MCLNNWKAICFVEMGVATLQIGCLFVDGERKNLIQNSIPGFELKMRAVV